MVDASSNHDLMPSYVAAFDARVSRIKGDLDHVYLKSLPEFVSHTSSEGGAHGRERLRGVDSVGAESSNDRPFLPPFDHLQLFFACNFISLSLAS
jgi:hypothetical protein